MKSHKFAFTLAELMIVLSVIGILSAILLPVAFQSTPDKDILKFKKANNTLATVVREMISSDKYYKYGSLAYPVWAEDSEDSPKWTKCYGWTDAFADPCPIYFCKVFSDIVSAKETACNLEYCGLEANVIVMSIFSRLSTVDKLIDIDLACSNMLIEPYSGSGLNQIKSTDNVVFYEIGMSFGREVPQADGTCSGSGVKSKDEGGYDICLDENGKDYFYHPFCVDIDGIEGPIKPFGYGIRTDGKIKAGARADWWLKRDITKKETDCCPKALNDAGLCDTNDTVCAS